MARLFVAAWPPAAVLDAIEALPRPDEPGVRWIARERWHVTLRFLGECEVEAAEEALAGVVAAPAVAVVGPAVSRLGRDVVCLPVGGLDPVVAAVRSATEAVGRPPDPRPFAGHLTLARLRGRAACGVTGTAFQASFPVAEIALVVSEHGHDCPRYRTVATRDLRSGSAGR